VALAILIIYMSIHMGFFAFIMALDTKQKCKVYCQKHKKCEKLWIKEKVEILPIKELEKER
jgi:hypothetical protein